MSSTRPSPVPAGSAGAPDAPAGPPAPRPTGDPVPGAARPERVSAIVVAAVILGFVSWVLLTLPIQPAMILTAAAVLSYVAWLATTYTRPVRSRRVIATYLAAVAFQFIHMAEEYTGAFPHEIVELFDSPRQWSEKSFLLTFVFAFGALWCLAGAGALYQVRIANYMLWFYALGAGLINAISHFVFPIIRGGYFPGLYTAAGHLALSILLIHLLLRESRPTGTGTGTGTGARPAVGTPGD